MPDAVENLAAVASGPAARFICTTPKCGHLMPVDDEAPAVGRTCARCGGWASLTTSPVGRWAAHRAGIELPEAAAFCSHDFANAPTVTGIRMVDMGGARICPNRAEPGGVCAFHGGEPEAVEAPVLSIVEAVALQPDGDPCDWCLAVPADGRPLRPVPGQRVSHREMRVCAACAPRLSRQVSA